MNDNNNMNGQGFNNNQFNPNNFNPNFNQGPAGMPNNNQYYQQPMQPAPNNKSNKTMLIVGVIVLIAVVAAVLYFVVVKKDDNESDNKGNNNQQVINDNNNTTPDNNTNNNTNTNTNNDNSSQNNNTNNDSSNDATYTKYNEYGKFTDGVMVRINSTETTYFGSSTDDKYKDKRLLINASIKNERSTDIVIYTATAGPNSPFDYDDPNNVSIFHEGDNSTSLALVLYYAPANKSLKEVETSELKTTFIQVKKPMTIGTYEQLKLKPGEEMDVQLFADLTGDGRWGTDYQPYVMLYRPSNTFFLMGK